MLHMLPSRGTHHLSSISYCASKSLPVACCLHVHANSMLPKGCDLVLLEEKGLQCRYLEIGNATDALELQCVKT